MIFSDSVIYVSRASQGVVIYSSKLQAMITVANMSGVMFLQRIILVIIRAKSEKAK